MLYRYRRSDRTDAPGPRSGDRLMSVLLPAAVIALGVALSLGATGGFDAFIGLCTSVIGG